MPDHRPSERPVAPRPAEIALIVLAVASGAVLVTGVVRTLVTGETGLWPLAAAIILAASLTLMRSIRRTRGAGADRTPTARRLDAGAAIRGETQPRPARRG
ncbi:hypothetical protein [Frondihabitans australicus]|uniref:Uncharacterized protein n=1 Tax=Frondihabitans australicus TaxID=386892 RepID=A0A495IL44_9MICO|nr:hypothetical protein [Frondihabitans australicus]RKR76694.1 hypothetical protein C8E83_3871 [Frondihabitans australicus]